MADHLTLEKAVELAEQYLAGKFDGDGQVSEEALLKLVECAKAELRRRNQPSTFVTNPERETK